MPSQRPPVFTRDVSDVTQDFQAASLALKTGKLVKDDIFSLFDAVPSLEIMDPKMDAGYVDKGEAFESEYDVTRRLSQEEVISIMDRILAQEMAWHSGEPLSTTIFTSTYIFHLLSIPGNAVPDKTFLDPYGGEDESQDPLLHKVLRSYALATIKCLHLAREAIKSEAFYEEEDVNTHTFGLQLLHDIDCAELGLLLDQAMDWCKSFLSKRNDELSPVRGIAARLLFRKSFMESMRRPVDEHQRAASTSWKFCRETLVTTEATAKLGKEPPDSTSHKFQRLFPSTTPPRSMVAGTIEEGFVRARSMIAHIHDVSQLSNCQQTEDKLNLLWSIQTQKPPPLTYVRAVLQMLVSNDNRHLLHFSMKSMVLSSLQDFCLIPPHLIDALTEDINNPGDPITKAHQILDVFVTKAAPALVNLMKALCQNSCRVRRNLVQLLIDWDSLQVEAEQLDEDMRPFLQGEEIKDPELKSAPLLSYPLSSWAYYWKLVQMEWVLQMGFETQIYRTDELATMYWHLSYILSIRETHGNLIREYSLHRLSPNRASGTLILDELTRLYRLYATIDLATSMHQLAAAFSHTYSWLNKLSLIQSPAKSKYQNLSTQVELRSRPFSSLEPPTLPITEDLEKGVDKVGSERLAEVCKVGLAAAKKGIESQLKRLEKEKDKATAEAAKSRNEVLMAISTGELKSVMRSCIAMSLAVDIVSRAVTNGNLDKVVVDMGGLLPWEAGKGLYHRWWIVPRVSLKE